MFTYLDVYVVIGKNPRKYWVGKCDDKPDNLWIRLATGIDPDNVISIEATRYAGKNCWLIYLEH